MEKQRKETEEVEIGKNMTKKIGRRKEKGQLDKDMKRERKELERKKVRGRVRGERP